MEIKGYTLYGDYYLADDIIPNKTWKESCEIKKEITLSNGKTVIAHTLSKKELRTIPREERKISKNGHFWYWTSTPDDDSYACYVGSGGVFYDVGVTVSDGYGGARLGFKNPF